MPDKESIINEVIEQIWAHPCPAYRALRERISTKAEELTDRGVVIQMDRTPVPADTTRKSYRWY